jgi:anti-sigma B factor antagonist
LHRKSGAAPPRRAGGVSDESTLLTVRIDDSNESVSVVVLAGELDLGTISRMEEPLAEQIGQRRAVLVDLREVSFIDSSGIGALIRAFRSSDGTPMNVLIHPGSQVERIFEVAAVTDAMPIFSDGEQAMAYLRKDGA